MASRHLAGSVGVNERSPIRGEPPEDSAAHRFRSLIRDRSAELGVDVVIAYEAWSASGGYIIHVNGAVDLLFEIDDWVEGARVMDPHGEDVSGASSGFQRVVEALYLRRRLTQVSAHRPWRAVAWHLDGGTDRRHRR
jgi:hypothetical protein